MEDIFGKIEYRSKSDSTVMRILRSAMDKAHEKLQSNDGPIEFLHERSTFYELAAILVEGGLNIVQEETDVLEGNSCDKILSDLVEIRHWLQKRIQDMKLLIVEKDRELTESIQNESNLRQALEIKERELAYLHEKLDPGQLKDHEDSHEFLKLKNSVDLQVLNIKQKVEDEKKSLITEARKRKSRLSCPNLSFDFLDKDVNQSAVFREDDSCGIRKFSLLYSKSELLGSDQNVLIRRMSSDIDILKETLDLAFGKMHSAEVLPLEKQWRWTIERDIESLLVKGFIRDLQECFDEELKKKVSFFKANWFPQESNEENLLKEDIYMVFIREMTKAWNVEKDAFAFEGLVREDVYYFVLIEAMRDFQFHLTETEKLKQLNLQDFSPRSREFITDEDLTEKLNSLLRCLEAEEDLMPRSSSEIKEYSVSNKLAMFSSVSGKLESALQQLYTIKELLAELGQSPEEVSDDLEDNNQQAGFNNMPNIEPEKNQPLIGREDRRVFQTMQSDNCSADIMHIQQVLGNVENLLHENIDSKCSRLEAMKHQVDTLTESVASMRTTKVLFEKAFISRSHNLKLAETEVDLLGDQVEALLCVLERIYLELNRNASVLARYFEVYDILKLIKRELYNGVSSKPKS